MNTADDWGSCPADPQCHDACIETCYDSLLLDFVDRCCDCSGRCSLSGWQGTLALSILFLTLVLLAKRRWGFLPLGRTMGPAFCAVLMVGVESVLLPASVVRVSPTCVHSAAPW